MMYVTEGLITCAHMKDRSLTTNNLKDCCYVYHDISVANHFLSLGLSLYLRSSDTTFICVYKKLFTSEKPWLKRFNSTKL